jgi:hypothetical protein
LLYFPWCQIDQHTAIIATHRILLRTLSYFTDTPSLFLFCNVVKWVRSLPWVYLVMVEELSGRLFWREIRNTTESKNDAYVTSANMMQWIHYLQHLLFHGGKRDASHESVIQSVLFKVSFCHNVAKNLRSIACTRIKCRALAN